MNAKGPADAAEDRSGGTAVGLARDSSLNVAGAVVRQVAVFGVTFLIAEVLGADQLGVYAQAFALRALLLLASVLGMRVAMTYFIASFRADGDAGGVRGAVRIGLGTTGVVSVVVAAITILVAPALADGYFNDPDLTTPIRLVALSLPFMVIMTVALAATRGFKTMRAFAGIGLVFEPATRLILTGAVLALGLGIDATLVALVVSSMAAAVLAVRAIRKRLATLGSGAARFPYRAVASFAAFSWVASTATQGLLWGDIIILGAFVGSVEIGVYQVATRVVLLALFAVAPLTASLGPRVSDSWARGNRSDVREHYVTLTGWTWRLSLPIFAVLVVFTEPVLGLFGEEFGVGTTVTRMLIVGALVETLGAPASVMLNQVGKNRLNMVFAVGALGFDVALALLLIPTLGIEGAAIAWAATLGVFGLVRIVAVRRLITGCFPWSKSHTKGTVAVLVALVVGWGFTVVVEADRFGELIVGSVLIGSVYIGTLLALGLSDEDRHLLRSVARRVSVLSVIRTGPIRRLRDRLATARLEAPTDAVRLDRLISPLRYDILVRADFFRLARDNSELVEADVDGFIEVAKNTDYYVWYREVAAHVIGIDAQDNAELDEGFARRVRKSLELLDRYETSGGFDARFPVTVRRMSDEATPTGKRLVGERLVPVDGCHRLALLHLDQREYLQVSEYRLTRNSAPLVDNTPVLIGALRLASADYYAFIASGFFDQPVGSREELVTNADASGETVSRDVAAVLAVDEPSLPDADQEDSDTSEISGVGENRGDDRQ